MVAVSTCLMSSNLDLLIGCWIAANEFDSIEVQRLSLLLGVDGYDLFNKPVLVLLSEKAGFRWQELDSGVWCNYAKGAKLSPEDIVAEIARVRQLKENHDKITAYIGSRVSWMQEFKL